MQLMYNVTDRTSFDALPDWLTKLNHHVPSTTPCGEQTRPGTLWSVYFCRGRFATNGALFHEESATALVGVTEVFQDLVKKILDAEDGMQSVDTFRRRPQDEIIESCVKDQPK
ncbi:hypothetical protein EDC04DRAFT_3090179, partial [Pisolithus marmoratus]